MKILTSTLAAITLLFCLYPHLSDAQSAPQPGRPKIAIVLEGGGALGFAHVGVLKVLEEARIPVHFISGTSMGSIVGAAYASGRTIPELEAVILETNWDELFNENVPRDQVPYRQKYGRDGEIFASSKFGIQDGSIAVATALVEGQKIEPLFRRLFGKAPASTSFDALPIPYRAVAADLETGEAVVLSAGSLALAARASMSVPGFFSPVMLDGRMLVDGGITNNFPVDVALAHNPDVIIGVEFKYEPRKRAELTGPLAISAQILDLLLERTSESRRKMLRPQDILIQPDLAGYSSTSFKSAEEILKAGEVAARALLPTLQKYSIPPSDYDAFLAHRIAGSERTPTISYVRVESSPPGSERAVLTHFNIPQGQPLDRTSIEEQTHRLFRTGNYRSVTYEVEEKDGKHGVVIRAEEKSWLKNYVRLGFALEDNFDSDSSYSLAADLRLRNLNNAGAYLDTQIELGRMPRLFVELYQPVSADSPFFFAPELTLQRQDLRVRRDDTVVAEYQRDLAFLGLKGGIDLQEFGELAVGWRRGNGTLDHVIGERDLPEFDYDIGEYFGRFVIDRLDSPDFPTRGLRVSVSGKVSREDAGADEEFEQGIGSVVLPLTIGANTLILGADGGASSSDLPVERSYSLGGFFNLSGYPQSSLVADNYWISRAVLFRRIAEGSSSLFNFGGYVGGTFEYASLYSDAPQIGDTTGIVAGSAFVGIDTPLLPLYFGFGINNQSEQSFYLALGRLQTRRP